jgi:hypothetical protein
MNVVRAEHHKSARIPTSKLTAYHTVNVDEVHVTIRRNASRDALSSGRVSCIRIKRNNYVKLCHFSFPPNELPQTGEYPLNDAHDVNRAHQTEYPENQFQYVLH